MPPEEREAASSKAALSGVATKGCELCADTQLSKERHQKARCENLAESIPALSGCLKSGTRKLSSLLRDA